MTYAVDAESFMKLGVRTKKGRDAESKRCLGSYNAAHCRKRVYGEIRKRKSCKAATKACRHRSTYRHRLTCRHRLIDLTV